MRKPSLQRRQLNQNFIWHRQKYLANDSPSQTPFTYRDNRQGEGQIWRPQIRDLGLSNSKQTTLAKICSQLCGMCSCTCLLYRMALGHQLWDLTRSAVWCRFYWRISREMQIWKHSVIQEGGLWQRSQPGGLFPTVLFKPLTTYSS